MQDATKSRSSDAPAPENGKRNRRFPTLHVENPDELEVDELVRIMGRTPPPPQRQERKAKRRPKLAGNSHTS